MVEGGTTGDGAGRSADDLGVGLAGVVVGVGQHGEASASFTVGTMGGSWGATERECEGWGVWGMSMRERPPRHVCVCVSARARVFVHARAYALYACA